MRQYYVLDTDIKKAAGNLIIDLMKKCNIKFVLWEHNYEEIWKLSNNENYRDYIYKGFKTVHGEFYDAAHTILSALDYSDDISALFMNLRDKMNLPEDEEELPQKTYLLFLTDYLIAAKLDELDWVENDLSPEKFSVGHNEKKIIAKAMVIALFGKAFKGCLISSNDTLEIFNNILENLEKMYKIVFSDLRDYIPEKDKKEVDRFCDGGVGVLEELQQNGIVVSDYFDLLKEKLQAMRPRQETKREKFSELKEKFEDARRLEIQEKQEMPQQRGFHTIQKKAYNVLLLLLLGGSAAGVYYMLKNYTRDWLPRLKVGRQPFWSR